MPRICLCQSTTCKVNTRILTQAEANRARHHIGEVDNHHLKRCCFAKLVILMQQRYGFEVRRKTPPLKQHAPKFGMDPLQQRHKGGGTQLLPFLDFTVDQHPEHQHRADIMDKSKGKITFVVFKPCTLCNRACSVGSRKIVPLQLLHQHGEFFVFLLVEPANALGLLNSELRNRFPHTHHLLRTAVQR